MSQKSGLKNVEVVALENKIQEIKKEYKKLVKEIEKYDDEQGREKLNNLIIELQEKSE